MFSLLLCKPLHRSHVTRQVKVRELRSCFKFQILLDVIIVLRKYQPSQSWGGSMRRSVRTMFRGYMRTCAASYWSIMLLESFYWPTTSNPHLLEQSVDKHNKIIRSGIIIVLTLGSVQNMESLDNRLGIKTLCCKKTRERAERMAKCFTSYFVPGSLLLLRTRVKTSCEWELSG